MKTLVLAITLAGGIVGCASVPPEVKTISSASAPSRLATWPRASSTASCAARPKACVLDGLPKCSARNGSIASFTLGAIGVVAL